MLHEPLRSPSPSEDFSVSERRPTNQSEGEPVILPRKVAPRSCYAFLMGDHPGIGVVYGLVNFTACVPALVSYAHIVFPSNRFASAMPLIVKLYFLSSGVHQLIFIVMSTLDFAVGQIQDVGLIFLAAMVRNIVKWAVEDELSDEELVATCLWQCALSTVVVGICVVLVGKLELGQYVQMIPLPVVGGYLGYIGYFCFIAGLASATGLDLSTPSTLVQLWDSALVPKLSLLAVMTTAMLVVHFKVKHYIGMPMMLLFQPMAFFIGLQVLGISADECRDSGWLPPPIPAAQGLAVFRDFDTSLVHWEYIPRQVLSLAGLILVVSFGSSLDVAAIQAEMGGEQLDYNQELITIGWANVFSGLTGGSTGSYIFSQTIFSAKRGVASRLNGTVVAVGEFLLFFTSIDVLRILPNAYIGAIMCLFGVDIMLDWLINSRTLMAPAEYGLVWFSFASVMWLTAVDSFGVIDGMLLGTIATAAYFAVKYACNQDTWEIVSSQSSITSRPFKERRILARAAAESQILAVGIKGFLFFASSLALSQGILSEATKRRARFVCLDFRIVCGLDSTAAGQLKFLITGLAREGTVVILSSLTVSAGVLQLLEAHGIVGNDGAIPASSVFDSLDEALKHCENQFLQDSGIYPRSLRQREERFEDILLEYMTGLPGAKPGERAVQDLAGHFSRQEIKAGATLFRRGDRPESIFIVTAGYLRIDEVPPRIDGVGTILGDASFYGGSKSYGCDAVAGPGGCVVYYLRGAGLEELEVADPVTTNLLHKMLLRDNVRFSQQFLVPKAVGL